MSSLLGIVIKTAVFVILLDCIQCYNDSNIDTLPQDFSLPYTRIKVGRKERCRHVVKKEVRKYSNHVKALANRVMQLQRDIIQLRNEHQQKDQELETLKVSVSSQMQLLQQTMQNLSSLQSKIDHWENRRKPPSSVPQGILKRYLHESFLVYHETLTYSRNCMIMYWFV